MISLNDSGLANSRVGIGVNQILINWPGLHVLAGHEGTTQTRRLQGIVAADAWRQAAADDGQGREPIPKAKLADRVGDIDLGRSQIAPELASGGHQPLSAHYALHLWAAIWVARHNDEASIGYVLHARGEGAGHERLFTGMGASRDDEPEVAHLPAAPNQIRLVGAQRRRRQLCVPQAFDPPAEALDAPARVSVAGQDQVE